MKRPRWGNGPPPWGGSGEDGKAGSLQGDRKWDLKGFQGKLRELKRCRSADRIATLMHDPQYRLGVAWQNVAYNQPPWTGYFIGEDMKRPARPAVYMP